MLTLKIEVRDEAGDQLMLAEIFATREDLYSGSMATPCIPQIAAFLRDAFPPAVVKTADCTYTRSAARCMSEPDSPVEISANVPVSSDTTFEQDLAAEKVERAKLEAQLAEDVEASKKARALRCEEIVRTHECFNLADKR